MLKKMEFSRGHTSMVESIQNIRYTYFRGYVSRHYWKLWNFKSPWSVNGDRKSTGHLFMLTNCTIDFYADFHPVEWG